MTRSFVANVFVGMIIDVPPELTLSGETQQGLVVHVDDDGTIWYECEGFGAYNHVRDLFPDMNDDQK